MAHVVFSPQKGASSLYEKGGFTGWKVGECLKGLALYENRPAAGFFKNAFTLSACGKLAYISHRQENV